MFLQLKTLAGVEIILNSAHIVAIYREPSMGRLVTILGTEYTFNMNTYSELISALERCSHA